MSNARVSVSTVEKDLGARQLSSDLKSLKGSFVDVGVFGGTNSKRKRSKAPSIVAYAFANEFGAEIIRDGKTVKIPERSFMRSAVEQNRVKHQNLIDVGLGRVGLGQIKPAGLMLVLGTTVQRDVRQKIRSGPFEKNAESTIARKRSSKPLIDTGTLRLAIKYKTGKV